MTISSVSSTNNAYQTSSVQDNLKQARQDFQNLAGALQSGDLSGAQNAFSALQQIMQSVPASGQTQSQGNSTQNQLSTDMTALAKALQSGDMSSAQDAFKKLQQDMQVARQGHHHAHGAKGASNAPSSSTGSSTTGTTDSDGDNDGSAGKAVNVTA